MITEETEPTETNQKMDVVDQIIMQYSVEIQASKNIEYFVDQVIHESKKGDHQPILNSYHLMNEDQLNILQKYFD